MNEENNNPWENTNNNGMTDNTIYVQPSQTDDAAGTQNTAGTEAGPQPMPSSDNMYRFQNTNPGGGQEPPKPPKQKKNGGMKKTLLSAVVFGVVAAFCFFAIVKICGLQVGTQKSNSGEIGTVNTDSGNTELTAVSGGAVAGVSDVSGIVENVMPSIVSITETSMQKSIFGEYPSEGAGSGFIVKQDDKELLIVTNNHVVSGAESITVKFIDDTTAKATVKGTDSTADLAVITVKLSDLKEETKGKIKIATLGHSDDVKVGQMAIAIGNALGYGQSVTVGYISAKDREVEISDENGSGSNKMVLLQTDAAINPGNSGGVLINMDGQVVGINNAKLEDTSVEGMGYAIPITTAKTILTDLMNASSVSTKDAAFLGVVGRDINESYSSALGIPSGIYVSQVVSGSPAEKAGISAGDVITKFEGNNVSTMSGLKEKLALKKANTKVKITFKRANQSGTYEEKTVTVTLGKKSDFSDVTTDNSSDSSNDSNNNSNNGNNNGNSNGNSGNSNGNSGDYGYGNGNFGNDNGNGYINPYEYFFGNNY